MVVAEASKGIATVARESGVPVIFGVLTTDTMQQALREQESKAIWDGVTVYRLRDGKFDGSSVEGVTLPDFLGVGTQKGGTTYLYELLKRHPQVFLAKPKEQHFFSLHWQRGADWYRRQFASSEESQICGEITPYYLFHPEARANQSLVPNVKLIVLLRDPVERALSRVFS